LAVEFDESRSKKGDSPVVCLLGFFQHTLAENRDPKAEMVFKEGIFRSDRLSKGAPIHVIPEVDLIFAEKSHEIEFYADVVRSSAITPKIKRHPCWLKQGCLLTYR